MTRYTAENHPSAAIRAAYERKRLNGGYHHWANDEPDDEPEVPIRAPDVPTIRIQGGQLHEIVALAADALGRSTLASPFRGHYRRGNLLVRATRLADEGELAAGGVKRQRGALVIAAADPDGLRITLTAVARWEKFD